VREEEVHEPTRTGLKSGRHGRRRPRSWAALLMWNNDVEIALARPTKEGKWTTSFRTAKAEPVIFVTRVRGTLERRSSATAVIGRANKSFVPVGTTYRFPPRGASSRYLVFENPGTDHDSRAVTEQLGRDGARALLPPRTSMIREAHEDHIGTGTSTRQGASADGYPDVRHRLPPLRLVGWAGTVSRDSRARFQPIRSIQMPPP